MPLLPPLILKPRRRRKKNARAADAAPLPAAGVVVESVTIHSLHEIDFAFNAPVTSVGGAGNEQIVIISGGEPNTPSSSEQISATVVRFWFESVTAAGDAWSIDAVPEGLDFHGLTFAVPQSGVVS